MAALFAAAAILYGFLWMYYVRHPGNPVELGFNLTQNVQYDEKTHSIAVESVVPGSPAESAGLRPGDRIVEVNGQRLDTSAPFDEAWARGRPGDPVELTVVRPGEPKPVVLHGTFRASTQIRTSEGLAKTSALQVIGSFPILFLVVGFTVLFLRIDDPYAWLLALLFCGFVAAPNLVNPAAMHPAVRAFVLAYRAIFFGLLSAVFYTFFALFPARSFLERQFPWLKWVGLALAVCLVLPGLRTGDPHWPIMLTQFVGARVAHVMGLAVTYAFFALGLISLAGISNLHAHLPWRARAAQN